MKKNDDFVLSEKIRFYYQGHLGNEFPSKGKYTKEECLWKEDVKEFIIRLKDALPNNEKWYGIGGKKLIQNQIDTLAGEELNK